MGYEWRRNESNGFNNPNYDPVATISGATVGGVVIAGSNPVSGLDSTAFTGLNSNPAITARNILSDLSGSVARINQAFGVVSSKDTTQIGRASCRERV